MLQEVKEEREHPMVLAQQEHLSNTDNSIWRDWISTSVSRPLW